MLITNYPDQQQVAVAAGAEYGFGKKELQTEQTRSRLAKFLEDKLQEPKNQRTE